MSRADAARRVAARAAYGGGGVGLVGAGMAGVLAGVLVAEARLARRWIGVPTQTPPHADGHYLPPEAPTGNGRAYAALTLAMLGDSSAAGLGADAPGETPGGVLALGLAEAAGRPVRLVCVAEVGAESSALAGQVRAALAAGPDVAVIMIGANDVTHRIKPPVAVRSLGEAVTALRAAGCEVVVGTCPDLGTIEPLWQPLRWVARRSSRALAAAQTIATVEAGGRTVSLADLLGPEFAARPGELFGPDRFHPSAAGYAAAARALLPSVLAALALLPEEEERPDAVRGEGLRPVAEAAVLAAEEPGTEVAGTSVGGRSRGPRGRWALLRHRLPWRPGPAAGPAAGVRLGGDALASEVPGPAPVAAPAEAQDEGVPSWPHQRPRPTPSSSPPPAPPSAERSRAR